MVRVRSLLVVLAVATLSACAAPVEQHHRTEVVATTPIVADLVRHVAGERAEVTALMPPGVDPHTYEPRLRAVRDIANADIAFTNGLLLEPHSLSTTIEEALPDNAPMVPLAEQVTSYGGKLKPLVENIALDTVWLGMRIVGKADSEVEIVTEKIDGPEDSKATAYITSTFGVPELVFDEEGDNYFLPADAHTHVSWSFSKPGMYHLTFAAKVKGKLVARNTINVAVGVDAPNDVLDEGHVDIAVDLAHKSIMLRGDSPDGTNIAYDYDPATTTISVPNSTLQQIPAQYRFMGRPGDEVYLLPQAVLGKHVHGEVDPHVWHNMANARAMVEAIRDKLSEVDPAGAQIYSSNAAAYIAEIDRVNKEVRTILDTIPKKNRHLVTTHDGYAYLGDAYGLSIAGFVSPNPSVEPSPRDIIALTRTLENLHVPAVFIEPQLALRANHLTVTADKLGIQVCRIYGDSLDDEVPTYLDFMKYNAHSLARCLGQSEGK
ncbi:anchored repeat ABC transporter, substrate-binding protein [Corynebacterium diphtheriae]|nr:anchored repeat ABC transporter, substrate-binding protein [Corynebacterium diphtheriae]